LDQEDSFDDGIQFSPIPSDEEKSLFGSDFELEDFEIDNR
jgi:hypothetical protein